MLRAPFHPILAALLTGLLAAACDNAANGPLELRPVAADAVRRLEAEIGSDPAPKQADPELVDRTRRLVERVAGQSGDLRASFAEQAKELGESVVPVLSGWVGESGRGWEERRAAIELLSNVDTPRAGRSLIHHVTDHPEKWVRSNCAWVLGATHQDQCVPRLVEALREESEADVRTSIAHALSAFGCYAAPMPPFGNDAATERLWRFGDPEHKLLSPTPSSRLQLEVWRRIASLSEPDPTARERTIAVLGSLPAWAGEMLGAALRDTSADVRRGSARALAGLELRGAAAGATLHESLLRDPEVTREAIEALGAMHHQPAADAIAAWLDKSRPIEMRVAAAGALGKLDVPKHVPALERTLAADEPRALRTASAISLVSYGRESEAFPILADALAADDASAGEIQSTIDTWLQARVARGDAKAQALLQAWVGPSATRESRAKLLRDEIEPLLR